jgi:8-oxo-dGTP pyrophosphatase MutT (NUDIX family)
MPAKYPKVAVIVYTTDPEGTRRFLLRHNKPFNGYEDEWTVVFGSIDPGEDALAAALREAYEELGVAQYSNVSELAYTSEYIGKHGPSIVRYFAVKVANLDIRVVLNEESIGYDWVTLETAQQLMRHVEESKALTLIA